MGKAAYCKAPGGFLGTNLRPKEALRLVSLLCVPPWLFAAVLFASRLVPLPVDLLGWLVAVLAGPAAWGAFISAVADGRTLLGRPRGPEEPMHRLWGEIRRVEAAATAERNPNAEPNDVIAEDGSAVSIGRGVAVVGDGNVVVTGAVGGNLNIGDPHRGAAGSATALRTVLVQIRAQVDTLPTVAMSRDDRADALHLVDRAFEQLRREHPPMERVVSGLEALDKILAGVPGAEPVAVLVRKVAELARTLE